jgi:uncharacterized protein involved in exopolysaccharide biosynthesis
MDGAAARKARAAQMRLLASDRMADPFIADNQLAKDADYNEILAPTGPLKRAAILLGFTADPASLTLEQRVRVAFAKRLSITKGEGAQAISISFRSKDPALAARYANDYAARHVALMSGADKTHMPASAAPETSALQAASALRARLGGLRSGIEGRKAERAHHNQKHRHMPPIPPLPNPRRSRHLNLPPWTRRPAPACRPLSTNSPSTSSRIRARRTNGWTSTSRAATRPSTSPLRG